MGVEVTTLPSGIRVVTHALPDLETVSVGAWINAGSRREEAGQQGLSHLLEHMVFKGTRRRDARQIAEEIEAVGGDLNGATSAENTAYQARMLAGDAELALDMLADILIESEFSPEEMEREKSVIIQEIGETQDTPDDLVFDLFNEAAFPDHPLGRTIAGTPKSVASFDRASVTEYLNNHYVASSTIIAAAGAVNHAQIVELVTRQFASLPNGPVPKMVPAVFSGGERRLKRRHEQTQIVIGFEGASYVADDCYAAQLFSNAVGGGMSSRLFQEVREKRGLSYSIYSFQWGYADTGLFGFHASAAHKDIPELAHVAIDCMTAASVNLNEAELRRAKAQMKVANLTALESPVARADQVARQILAFGRVLSREEIVNRIEATSLMEVKSAGAKMLSSSPIMATVGQANKAPHPDRIREWIGTRQLIR